MKVLTNKTKSDLRLLMPFGDNVCVVQTDQTLSLHTASQRSYDCFILYHTESPFIFTASHTVCLPALTYVTLFDTIF